MSSSPRLSTNIVAQTLVLVALAAGFTEGCRHAPTARERRTIAAALKQPSKPAPKKETAPSEPAPAGPAADAPPVAAEPVSVPEEPKPQTIESVIAADSAKLSVDEKKLRTEIMLGEMRDALKRAMDLLAEARAAKDIVQLNCVNEKLTQIKGLLRISEQASIKMYEALAVSEEDIVNHEFVKMAVAHQKVLILRAEADQCVGEQTIYEGETEIEVVEPHADYPEERRALEWRLTDAYTNTDDIDNHSRRWCINEVEAMERSTITQVRAAAHALAMCRLNHPSSP